MSEPSVDDQADDSSANCSRSKAISLQEAYVETAAALAEVRQLYFRRAGTEAAELSRQIKTEQTLASFGQRLDTLGQRLDAFGQRLDASEEQLQHLDAFGQRLDALEERLQNVVNQLSPSRSLYRRIIRLIRGY